MHSKLILTKSPYLVNGPGTCAKAHIWKRNSAAMDFTTEKIPPNIKQLMVGPYYPLGIAILYYIRHHTPSMNTFWPVIQPTRNPQTGWNCWHQYQRINHCQQSIPDSKLPRIGTIDKFALNAVIQSVINNQISSARTWKRILVRSENDMRLFVLRYGKLSDEQIEKNAKKAIVADDEEEKLYLKKCRGKARSNQSTWKHGSLEAMKVKTLILILVQDYVRNSIEQSTGLLKNMTLRYNPH